MKTAGAISSIGHNAKNPAVDGNVVRVLSRIRAIACSASPPLPIHSDLASIMVQKTTSPRILNQSLMELGATVCTPKNPHCQSCPILDHCKAAKEEKAKKRPLSFDMEQGSSECVICGSLPIEDIEELKANMFPLKKKKNKIRQQIVVSALLLLDGNVLMLKRPKNGLLAGQWEFPSHILFESEPKIQKSKKLKEFSTKIMYEAIVKRVNALFHEEITEMVEKFEYIGSFLHIFSHIHQNCHVFRIYLDKKTKKEIIFDRDYEWNSVQSVDTKKLTMCVKKQWLIHRNFDRKKPFNNNNKLSGRKRKRQTQLNEF